MTPTAGWRVCSTSGCPTLVPAGAGRCDTCKATADAARGSPTARGYGRRHATRFRRGVLRADPTCSCPADTGCGHPPGGCGRPSTVADHHPMSRRDLVAAGLDPDDPRYGRGLCASCHGRATQARPDQRGGWNATQ